MSGFLLTALAVLAGFILVMAGSKSPKVPLLAAGFALITLAFLARETVGGASC